MSSLAWLQSISESEARAQAAEDARRAALTPRQRWFEDTRYKIGRRLVLSVLVLFPLGFIALAFYGAFDLISQAWG